jgi:hypothetical protein
MFVVNPLDRRRQPQVSLRAVREVLAEIDWPIREVTSQRFFPPRPGEGQWINESFGYILKIPKELSSIRKLWVGYLRHKEVMPPGIYAGMNPVLTGTKADLTPLKAGYRESPFSSYILLKQIIPQKQIDRMEKQFGADELKKKIKEILVKTYPFSLK